MLRFDWGYSRFGFEIEFEESISDLEATLAREHVHTATGHRHWKIAASWWPIAFLFNFLPLAYISLFQSKYISIFAMRNQIFKMTYIERHCPHVIQTGISIVASINPDVKSDFE